MGPPEGPEAIASCNSGTMVATLLEEPRHLCASIARCLLISDPAARGCCLRAVGPAEIIRELLTQTCVRRALVAAGVVAIAIPASRAIPWDELCDALCDAIVLRPGIAACEVVLERGIEVCEQVFPPGEGRDACIAIVYQIYYGCIADALDRYLECYWECVRRRMSGSQRGPG